MTAELERGRLRREWPLLGAATAAAAVYAVYGIVRHDQFLTSTDLAIFDQAVWHYSRFEAPETTVAAPLPSLLGDHFHPILALLAPLYWIWPDPRMLLLAQAGLVAAAALPVFAYARERVGRLGAYALALAYLAFWAVHTAIAFDFHEVAFAPLLTAGAILALDRERWRSFFACVALLLLVKEDLSLLVVAIGIYAALSGHRRAGAVVAVAGLAWYFVTTRLLIPWFADGRPFVYWSYGALGSNLGDALVNMVTDPWRTLRLFLTPADPKLVTLAALFAPFLLLPLASPLIVLCVPLLAERMFSSNLAYWEPFGHYSLTIAAIVALAAADGAPRVAGSIARLGFVRVEPRRIAAGFCVASLLLVVAIAPVKGLAPVPGTRLSPLADFQRSLRLDSRAVPRAAPGVLERLPDGAPVTAHVFLVPHVSARDEVHQTSGGVPATEYAVLIVGDPDRRSAVSPDTALPPEWSERYETVAEDSGVLLLRRRDAVP